MYKEGETAVEKGFTCRVLDWSSKKKKKEKKKKSNIEEWTYIITDNDKTDTRYCDEHPDCERGEDEPTSCHPAYVVTGSKKMDGVYKHPSGVNSKSDVYQEGNKFLWKNEASRWVISIGPSKEEANAHYKSGEAKDSTVPSGDWQFVFVEGKSEGDTYGESVTDLQVFRIPSNLTKNFLTLEDKGLICQMPEKEKSKEKKEEEKDKSKEEEWLFIPNNDEKERRCSGVCDCDSCVDEDDCNFHQIIKEEDISFLALRGSQSEQDGVYELKKDTKGNPGFFKHLTLSDLIFYKKGDFWVIGRGTSPNNATNEWSAKGADIPNTGWMISKSEFSVDIMRVTKLSSAFSEEIINTKEDLEKDGHIICTTENNQRIFIEVNGDDTYYCDKRQHCPKSGLDEKYCSIFVNLTFEKPIITSLGALGLGILVFMAFQKFLDGHGEQKQHKRSWKLDQRVRRSIDQIVETARKLGKRDNDSHGTGFDREVYKEIHDTPGGLRTLIGTGFSLLDNPGARHMLAKFILDKEKKIHGEDNQEEWQECVRRKAGSNKPTATFLDSIDEPGCLKWLKYKVVNIIYQDRWGRIKPHIKSWLRQGFLPLLSVTLYIFDYLKDTWMFNYLFSRLGFINSHCSLLKGLVYVYGFSIGVAGFLMGLVFQTDSALIGFDPSTQWCCALSIRLLLFILTPLLPVVVILKIVKLKRKREDLETEYKNIARDATTTWEKMRKLDEEEQEAVEAFSDLKMVETSTEAVVQSILLVIFTFASVLLPNTSGIGLLKENSFFEWAFLAFSFFTTLLTANKSLLGAVDIRKREQLDLKQKIVLGISFTFQLFAHVFLIVSIALLALPLDDSPAEDHTEDASLAVLQAVILIAAPIVLRWISIAVLHCCLSKNETRFWDLTKRKRLLHILANTWVTMPLRSNKVKEQVRKGTEIRWSMGMAGINILVTWAMTANLMEHKNPRFLPAPDFNSNTEFPLVGILPSLFSHFIGCAFLLLHYKKTHPWRNVYTRQREEATKSLLKEEDSLLEEVNTFIRLINIAVQVGEESEVDALVSHDAGDGGEVGCS